MSIQERRAVRGNPYYRTISGQIGNVMELGPRSGSRTKLSCVRCKQKKIRCDKSDPQCDKCSVAGTECVYAQRRQRARKPQQRDVVGRLSRQLEFYVNNPAEPTLSGQSAESSATVDSRAGVDLNSSNTQHKTSNQTPKTTDHESGGFYQMVTDARNTTVSKLSNNGLLSAEASPNVDSALDALNGALAALGNLTVSPHALPGPDPDNELTRDEKKKCVDDAYELLSTILPSVPIDIDLIKAMPDFVGSPHVHFDPAATLLYLTFIFEGRSLGPKRSATAAKRDYVKCLQSVPAWHESASGTVMDIIVAIATAMVAVTCFDYHLGWKFHCKACRFAERHGLDRSDISGPQASGGSSTEPDLQGTFWCLVQMDLLFRLFYDKPAVIKQSTTRRLILNAYIPVSSRLKPGSTIMLVLWARVFFILTEFFEYTESHDAEGSQRPEDFERKVDSFCDQIEELINDWPSEIWLKLGEHDPLVKWLHADFTIGAHTIIILMERKLFGDSHLPISSRSLRSSRAVLNAIIEMSDVDPGKSHHILTFYPFCAFFALYYHVLTCANPDECKEDLQVLEKVGQVLERAKTLRSEFIPISNAINALNHITKEVQKNRTSSAAVARDGAGPASSLPPTTEPRQRRVSFALPTQQDYPLSFDSISGGEVPQINFIDSTTDLPVDFGEGFEPMEYMRAIENEFAGRNWHESWWSIG